MVDLVQNSSLPLCGKAGVAALLCLEVGTGGLAAAVRRTPSMSLTSEVVGVSGLASNAAMSPGMSNVCPNTSSAGQASSSGWKAVWRPRAIQGRH